MNLNKAARITLGVTLVLGWVAIPVVTYLMWLFEYGRPGQWATAWGCLISWPVTFIFFFIMAYMLKKEDGA